MTATIASPEALEIYPFPEVPAHIAPVVEVIANHIKMTRGKEPTTEWEHGLDEQIATLLKAFWDGNVHLDLSPQARNEIGTNQEYINEVTYYTKIRASLLWPVSALIYMTGAQDIQMLGYDRWMVKSGPQQAEFHGGFGSEMEAKQFFSSIIIQGTTGDRNLDTSKPIAQINFGNLARIQVVMAPVRTGNYQSTASIRVPSYTGFTSLDDYVTNGTFPRGVAEFLRACARGGVNMVVAGGTSTGKTTLLRVLLAEIDQREHVVVVENGAELNLEQKKPDGDPFVRYCTPLSTIDGFFAGAAKMVDMNGLVMTAMRLYPDRVVLGEARGEEMTEVCKAMTSGHIGSMCTIHADGAEEGITKAIRLVGESEKFSQNSKGAAELVHDALEVVIHLGITRGRRYLTGVVEVGKSIGSMQTIYEPAISGGLTLPNNRLDNFTRIRTKLRPYYPQGILNLE